MTNHPNRSTAPNIFVANYDGNLMEVVVINGDGPVPYTMNGYATFHGFGTDRQVRGGASTCKRETKEDTTRALRERYGKRARVTFVRGRLYDWIEAGERRGYECAEFRFHSDGTVSAI